MAFKAILVSTTKSGTLVGNAPSGLDGDVVSALSGTVTGQTGNNKGIAQSSDGNFVLFFSKANNFDSVESANSSDKDLDLFLKNVKTGDLIRITNSNTMHDPNISDDGKIVTYERNGTVYKVNLSGYTATSTSVPTSTAVTSAVNAEDIHMSANGKYVVYKSGNQIYKIDISGSSPTTPELVSVDSDGTTVGNKESSKPFVSNDGIVVFQSKSDNFEAGNANQNDEIYLKNTDGSLIRISETAAGTGGEDAYFSVFPASADASISGNGRYVVFASTNTDFTTLNVPNSGDGINSAIYRKDLATGTIELVSSRQNGNTIVTAEDPSISANGRFVVFKSRDVVAESYNASDNNFIYVKDMSNGSLHAIDIPRTAVKLYPSGIPVPSSIPSTLYIQPYESFSATISADGKYVVLSSTQTMNKALAVNAYGNLADNNDGSFDVFRIDISSLSATPIGLDLAGTSSDDSINGGTLGDYIQGLTGNDTLNGLAGNDTLIGGDGNDTLNGGLGADTMNGGAGDDTYYVDNVGDVVSDSDGENDTVILQIASGTYTIGNGIENVTISNISAPVNVIGNSGANTITGNGGANKLEGLTGADTLIGGAGNDTLDGGAGDDSLIGGIGNDLYIVDNVADIIVEQANAGIDTVKIDAGFTLDEEIDEPDYTLGDNIEHIDASSFTGGIYLEGNSLANNLTGGNGNDTLDGADGVDTLKGGLGNDTYHVDLKITNAGKSTATVSLQDTLTELANQGEDTIHLYFDGASYLGTAPAKASTIILAANFEHLDASEAEALLNLTGNTVANHITGNDGNNIILGLAGNDTLEGLDGNDSLDGGIGNDSLVGGDGDDTLIGGVGLDTLAGGTGNDTYIINLTKASPTEASLEDTVTEEIAEGTDTIKLVGSQTFTSNVTLNMTAPIFENIENLDISGTASTKLNITGNDADNYLTGNAAANALEGGDGNDTLEGGAGNDTLTGGNDNDKLFGGAGLDTLTGNDGNDFIDGGADNDSISGGSGTDMLFGGLGNDTIDGGDDADFIDGEAGNDSLLGGNGNDTIFGGAGNDFIDGGDGFNQLEGEDGNDTIIGGNNGNVIEGGAGNDTLTGDDGNDNLQGGDGNDKLDGGNDDDYLNGGNGIDTLIGGAGADIFSFDSPVIAANADIINDFSGSGENEDGDKIQLDAYFFSAFLNSESVDGGNIAYGAKALDNNDFLIYDAATGKLYYDADGNGSKAQVLVATLSNKPATLSAADFQLIGSMAGANPLTGNSGNNTWNANSTDSIEGATHYAYNGLAGNDIITGNTAVGNSLSGGLGNDSITAGDQGDFLYGNEGNDTLQGGDSQDYLAGGDGNDSLSGQNDDDRLLGGAGNDKLDGGSGDDKLEGGDGNDTLLGSTGNDTLNGGNGNDVLTGGAGDDVFIFDSILTAANADTITDFTAGEDTLQLSSDVFRKLASGISEENLAFGTKAVTAEHFLIYDKNTGSLYYDADGAGAGAAIKFATLSNKPATIAVDDFQMTY